MRRFIRLVSTLTIILTIFLSLPSLIQAKRKLPALKSSSSTKSSSTGVTVKVKFRGDRKAVILNLSNLSPAKNVSYELQYDADGITQGAGGSVTISGNTESREILFGTCSGGACRYDKNIKNAKLTVTTTLKNGRRIINPFKLKV